MDYKKFLFLTDLHFGYERRNGHKIALHDKRAMDIAIKFAQDFKPDVLILGGDILDCGAISHHNKNKPGRTEGLKLLADATECWDSFIRPLEALEPAKMVYITGNHEDWLNDHVEEYPSLEGILKLEHLLKLDQWTVLPQGEQFDLGKLTFLHGDQLKGGEHIAKAAVISWERNIRFGHHHTYQVYTKTTPTHDKVGKTGVAVPCLCTSSPKYGQGAANRWLQGINYGYVFRDGCYSDYVGLITNGRMAVDGKVYKA